MGATKSIFYENWTNVNLNLQYISKSTIKHNSKNKNDVDAFNTDTIDM